MRKIVFSLFVWFSLGVLVFRSPDRALAQGTVSACSQCLQGCVLSCYQSTGTTGCISCMNGCQPACQNVLPNQLPSNIQSWLPASFFVQPGPCPGLTGTAKTDCDDCITNKHGAYTALGCIPTEPSAFVAKLLGWVIGIAGGIAFLLILYGGFQILTSSGDPEKLNNGKDIIVSAIAGILMIVFSVLLLKIIGVDILQIPGFGVG